MGCDGATCTECPLGPAGSVSLDPAPMIQSPGTEFRIIENAIIEGSGDPIRVPGMLPDLGSDPPVEAVPVPTPDPST